MQPCGSGAEGGPAGPGPPADEPPRPSAQPAAERAAANPPTTGAAVPSTFGAYLAPKAGQGGVDFDHVKRVVHEGEREGCEKAMKGWGKLWASPFPPFLGPTHLSTSHTAP